MRISVAVTTFNRFDFTINSIEKIIEDERVSEVLILDDASTDGSFGKLSDYYSGNLKVRVMRQLNNVGMSMNKFHAIGYCSSDYVLIADSDNIFDKTYLDALELVWPLENDTIYCPSFAKTGFNFTQFAGRTFDRTNIRELVSDAMGNCAMNCCNYVVPRLEYLRVYEYNPEMKATDTVFFNYLWLKAGNKFKIVPWMEYTHTQHEGSGFLEDVNYNMAKSQEMRMKMLSL